MPSACAMRLPFFAPQLAVHLLPDWETLPYDQFSPHQDLVSERLATLYQISHNACDVVIVPVTTALYRLPPREFLAAHTFFLKQGTKLDLDALRQQLTLAGYTHVTQVLTPGEYSVRGGLVDLFPMGSAVPYRLDLFDQEIESIRTFDVDTQRSIYPVKDVRLLPAREFPLDEAGISLFRQNFREKFEGDPSKSQLYKDVSNGLAPLGIEYYLPLFFEHTATLFDYLPDNALLCLHHGSGRRGAAVLARYPLALPVCCAATATGRCCRRKSCSSRWTRFSARSSPFRASKLAADDSDQPASTLPVPPVQVDRRAENPVQQAAAASSHNFDGRILLLAESLGRRETMAAIPGGTRPETGHVRKLCRNSRPARNVSCSAVWALLSPPGFHSSPLSSAFGHSSPKPSSTPPRCASRAAATPTRKSNVENMLRDLSELKVGDPVVHEQHGIGRYLGLVNLDLGEGETEFLHLEYAGGDKLYVPVSNLHVISRYSGASPESAPLHRLGSGQWEKAKKKALQQARDTAAELLNLYAQRAARTGLHVQAQSARLRGLCRQFRLRGNAGPGRRDPGGDRGHDLRPARWTGWSAAMSASARPKWPCAPPSSPWPTASRWRSWCPPPCSRSSISTISPTASPTGR